MSLNQKGYALVIILLLTIVLFFIGSAALTLGGTVRKTAALETEQKKAYYIAEAGIEKAVDKAAVSQGTTTACSNRYSNGISTSAFQADL